MAQQTIALPDSNFGTSRATSFWTFTENRPEIIDALKADTGDSRYISNITLTILGGEAISIAFTDAATGGVGAGLSSAFSQSGGIDIVLTSEAFSFESPGAHIGGRYRWSTGIGNAYGASLADRSATLIIRDESLLPIVTTPSVAIDAVSSGNSGTTVTLAATLTGSNYANATYSWTVSGGSLNDSTSATPIWTRPSVDSARSNFSISLSVSVEGDGVTTRSGVRLSTSVATISTTVLNPLPVASIGTATAVLNTIANGESGNTRNLDVTVTKGTGVYDNVSYRWTVGQGALSNNSIKNPVWTFPTVFMSTNVSVTLAVTFSGDNVTARPGSFFTIRKTATVRISPSVGQFTGDLSTGNFIRWSATTKSLSFGVYPEIIGSFVPSGTRRFLTNLSVTSTRFDIGFGPTSTSTARADLSPLFERAGAIKLTVGSTIYIIPMDSQDSSDNYRLTRPRSVISAFATAWEGAGTLEFIYPISMYHDGSVYHEVFLGSTRYKKIYLGSEEYI